MREQRLKIRIICLILAGLSFALCACGVSDAALLSEEKLNIVCTNFPAYDFSRSIAGERANVILLLPPGSESHSFEPTPQDITALMGCDLIVANGGVGESWLESLVSAGETEAPVLCMLNCVELVEEDKVAGMQEAAHAHKHDESCEHEHEHEHGHEAEYDEHVWTSPANAAVICDNICAALTAADPEGTDYYEARLEQYRAELIKLHEKFEELVDASDKRTIVFADRFPVRYFVEEYGLDYYAAFPGCAEDTEPSARTVAFLIDKVRENGLKAVYYIEFSNEKMADVIVEDTGCKKLLFHSCHNVGADELANGVTYLSLMEQNYQNLREGLN